MTILFTEEISPGKVDTLLAPVVNAEQVSNLLKDTLNRPDLSADDLYEDLVVQSDLILYTEGGRRFILLHTPDPEVQYISKRSRTFFHKKGQLLGEQWALHLEQLSDPATVLEGVLCGLYLGSYRIGRFKSEPKDKTTLPGKLPVISSAPVPALEQAAERGRQFAQIQIEVLDLVNAPSNKKRPADMGDWALRLGKQHGVTVKVLEEEALRDLGFHALLAVNQGSVDPPVCIFLEYRPERHAAPKLGLVGKGVTFDTGGVSLKPSNQMALMKSDMGGGAAVMGTIFLAAQLKLPVHLYGIVPATDNSIDARAIKPSDVIPSYSGKTIEIIDTDAEGRLIMADALSYMVRMQGPDVVIDLATLTGSILRTLGHHAAGLFTTDDQLARDLYLAGQETGERVWRLPLWSAYEEDLVSEVADIRNFSGKPNAGAINAAKFLQAFTDNHPRWAHLDIAGVAFTDSEYASQKSATAYGIRLLIQYLEHYFSS